MSEHKVVSTAGLRPFTRLAAECIGGLEALDAGKCPVCHQPIGEFRDRLSVKEFNISGMCQKCQDGFFGASDGSSDFL